MKYIVIIEEGEKSYGAYVPDLPGCTAVAESREEVVKLIQEAVAYHIEGLHEAGAPVPSPTSHIEFIEVQSA